MSDSNFNSDRRQMLKCTAAAAVSFLLLPAMKISNLAYGAKMEHVSESDPMAKTLGYKNDATKVDVKAFPKRAGAEGKKQFCNNCSFYTKANAKEGGCTIFQGKYVAAKGWCNTWTQKA